MSLSRRSFLGRTTAALAAVAYPRLASPPAAVAAPKAAAPVAAAVRRASIGGWWVISESTSPITASLVSGEKILHQMIVGPGQTARVQIPLWRRFDAENVKIQTSGGCARVGINWMEE